MWYPIHLRRTIQLVAPRVDAYTELGTPRSHTELNREYQRALDRDKNPLLFLYRSMFRFRSVYQGPADAKQTTAEAGLPTKPTISSQNSRHSSRSQLLTPIIACSALLIEPMCKPPVRLFCLWRWCASSSANASWPRSWTQSATPASSSRGSTMY